MKALKDTVFLLISAAIILPMPTLVLAYMTNLSFWDVVYR